MITYTFKTSKRSPLPLRVVLLFFVTIFGVYICFVCIKQIRVQRKPNNKLFAIETSVLCDIHDIPPEEIPYVHFPQPKTYSRGECSCTLVRSFAIFSMQRSGSGWFETLLNSHPNISSNGEIFSIRERRSNFSSIRTTLDTVYNLDWFSSAAKNECVAAVGLKWMLNQGIMDHQREILDYFNLKGVSIIFLFRRNLLRRLISVLANAYDRRVKQLNGTHKSHVHSKEEAEVLARFKPIINIEVLVSNLSQVEQTMVDSLQLFSSTRHIILYYEDIISNPKSLAQVQEFLRVPVRKLESRQVKIHIKPLSEQVMNWEDVYKTLNGTQIAFLCVDTTARHAMLSFVDGYSGYNQIPLHPDDQEKTAFITESGLYCYTVMPFGLKNAWTTYQRSIDMMFKPLIGKNMAIYIGDMVVKSKERGIHLPDLAEMFAILRQYEMKLNPAKCVFVVTFGKLLGPLSRKEGLKQTPSIYELS